MKEVIIFSILISSLCELVHPELKEEFDILFLQSSYESNNLLQLHKMHFLKLVGRVYGKVTY